MLRRPGRYLREPSEETRRALGSLDVFLQTPDTLALIVRNLETFAPLFVAAQTRPFVPDERLQAWFRTTAPGHREEMIRALRTWFAPGPDSMATFHGQIFTYINQGDR